MLKNKRSEYVRIAAAGERVLVTDRDRGMAELMPPAAGTPELPSLHFLHSQGQPARPPTYDARMMEAARRLDFEIYEPGA